MEKRGPKPKKLIDTTWRAELAYAIGLLATDGCLSCDGLLIDLTSKDREQLHNYLKCLNVKIRIAEKSTGNGRKALRVQFKNRLFYDFLLSIGLTQKKSLTLEKITMPPEYFFDFLRGCFDGDGSTYSYWDPRWRSSFMFYLGFCSGSKKFLEWIREEIKNRIGVIGHLTSSKKRSTYYQLKYAKKEAIEIIERMYYNPRVVCLSRKYSKIQKTLETNRKQQSKYT